MALHDPAVVEAIRDVQTSYAFHLDRFDVDAFASIWTEDATYDCTQVGMPLINGREAIAGFVAQFQSQVSSVVHYITNSRITTIDDDRAEGSCYYYSVLRGADGNRVEMFGRYDDVYRRTLGDWKIHERRLVPFLGE